MLIGAIDVLSSDVHMCDRHIMNFEVLAESSLITMYQTAHR
jgi:hypothetical protein